jgi:hypothetical protein
MATLNPVKSCQPFDVTVSLELLANNAPGALPLSAYIAVCACLPVPLPVRYSMMSVIVPELAGVYWVALGIPELSVVLELPTVVVPKVAEAALTVCMFAK